LQASFAIIRAQTRNRIITSEFLIITQFFCINFRVSYSRDYLPYITTDSVNKFIILWCELMRLLINVFSQVKQVIMMSK